MIHNVYAVRDELQGVFLTPTYATNDQVALRDFKYNINNNEQWKYSPTDFSLYRLGTLDDETGVYESKIEKVQNGRSVFDG